MRKRWLLAQWCFLPLHVAAASGGAAHFFIYKPVPGVEQKFEAGYQRHLDWHRQHGDPLAWYGWTVEDGERDGYFIDASIGEPFAAFDHRVDTAGDGADFKANAAPYATPMGKPTYELLRAVSFGTPLEDLRPSKRMQVTTVMIRPGHEQAFEQALSVARRVLAGTPGAPAHTWYRLVTGGEGSQYLLLVAREDWASFDAFRRDVPALLAGDADALRAFSEAVRATHTEMWRYRAELSLLPKAGR